MQPCYQKLLLSYQNLFYNILEQYNHLENDSLILETKESKDSKQEEKNVSWFWPNTEI